MANILTPGNTDVTMVAAVIGSNGEKITNPTGGISKIDSDGGLYTIHLSITYKNPPAVTASIHDGEGIATVIHGDDISSFQIRTSDTKNNKTKKQFSFIAVEQVKGA